MFFRQNFLRYVAFPAVVHILMIAGSTSTNLIRGEEETNPRLDPQKWESKTLEGWQLNISHKFSQQEQTKVQEAIDLLSKQLQEVVAVVPASAVGKLREVPLWFSPEYPGLGARAEYHPSRQWLVENGRDPVMARGVEFTNILIFEEETRRMPNFALHELAHAFHDQQYGFDNAEIKNLYERAKASGNYDRVQRQDATGRLSWDRAYALTNPMEYFAETSEAFFSRNDFFPFNRTELKDTDPQMDKLLEKLWNLEKP